MKLRPVAIYLPQFHPIPENDTWWGKGFTEWTNVAKAKPLFKGHYQPHLPADLGFYDLRLKEVMREQAALASDAGIEGFCFYHYWFKGKRLLERPVNQMMEDHSYNFPFMLCWANENWTRTWDGRDKELLISQENSPDDDEAHFLHLLYYFKDPRYIRVDGKPVFVVYKPALLNDAAATARRWRALGAEHGIELYLCYMVFGYQKDIDRIEEFDAAIDFEPFSKRRPVVSERIQYEKNRHGNKFTSRVKTTSVKILRRVGLRWKFPDSPHDFNLMQYEHCAASLKPLKDFPYKLYPSIVPGWDNTARRGKTPALILHNSTPDLFETWLRQIVNEFEPFSSEENFIFINAWNEWAEGNHLEPDRRWGRAYLDVVKRIFAGSKTQI